MSPFGYKSGVEISTLYFVTDEMAERGGQPGNQNAAKAKRWTAAIERCLEAWPGPPDSTDCTDFMRGINAAAFAFVGSMMATKDVQFFREFADRIDGKAMQAIEAEFTGNLTINVLRFADSDDGK